jgi:hypothetical protein
MIVMNALYMILASVVALVLLVATSDDKYDK